MNQIEALAHLEREERWREIDALRNLRLAVLRVEAWLKKPSTQRGAQAVPEIHAAAMNEYVKQLIELAHRAELVDPRQIGLFDPSIGKREVKR